MIKRCCHTTSQVQVPVMRDALLKQGNWQQIADRQRQAFFSPAASAQQSKGQMDDMLRALDFMCNLQPDQPQAPVSSTTTYTAHEITTSHLSRSVVYSMMCKL